MYRVVYHNLVLKKDLKKIPKSDQKKIVRTINKKLSSTPGSFGKPLIGDLKGYYRLRTDPYRVIFRINKKEIIVCIIKVGLRKDLIAYIESAKRLKLI